MEAMRCLKRRLSDIVYQQMILDATGQHKRAREDNATPSRRTAETISLT